MNLQKQIKYLSAIFAVIIANISNFTTKYANKIFNYNYVKLKNIDTLKYEGINNCKNQSSFIDMTTGY